MFRRLAAHLNRSCRRPSAAALVLIVSLLVQPKPCLARAVPDALQTEESRLGTQGPTNREFHSVVYDPHGIRLNCDGYVVGVEKALGRTIGVPSRHHPLQDYCDGAPSGDDGTASIPAHLRETFLKRRHRHRCRVLGDDNRTFVSHISRYAITTDDNAPEGVSQCLEYSAYAPESWDAIRMCSGGDAPRIDAGDAYEEGFRAVGRLRQLLIDDIATARKEHRPYTDMVVLAMGWNSSEATTIEDVNRILGNLLMADGNRRYLAVAIAWPAETKRFKWLPGHRQLSYFFKARDADEVGVVWGARVVDAVRSAAAGDVRVVVIGHSFGARLLGRACLDSRPHTAGLPRVDVFISLLGAFSMNRLVPKASGREGFPFSEWRSYADRLVLVWSAHDRFNPIANLITGANNVGCIDGCERALKFPGLISHHTADAAGEVSWHCSRSCGQTTACVPVDECIQRKAGARSIEMIDASDLICVKGYRGSGAHGDIRRVQMGRLLCNLIDGPPPRSSTLAPEVND